MSNFIFNMIKNGADKELIRHFACCFVFTKKSAVDTHWITCETYDENYSH